jgi:hypothetical protein
MSTKLPLLLFSWKATEEDIIRLNSNDSKCCNTLSTLRNPLITSFWDIVFNLNMTSAYSFFRWIGFGFWLLPSWFVHSNSQGQRCHRFDLLTQKNHGRTAIFPKSFSPHLPKSLVFEVACSCFLIFHEQRKESS